LPLKNRLWEALILLTFFGSKCARLTPLSGAAFSHPRRVLPSSLFLAAGQAIFLSVACFDDGHTTPLTGVGGHLYVDLAARRVHIGVIPRFQLRVTRQHRLAQPVAGDALVREGIGLAGVGVDVHLPPDTGRVLLQTDAVHAVGAASRNQSLNVTD